MEIIIPLVWLVGTVVTMGSFTYKDARDYGEVQDIPASVFWSVFWPLGLIITSFIALYKIPEKRGKAIYERKQAEARALQAYRDEEARLFAIAEGKEPTPRSTKGPMPTHDPYTRQRIHPVNCMCDVCGERDEDV